MPALAITALAWPTLAIILLAALPLGANRHVSWLFMALAVLALLTVTVPIDWTRGARSGVVAQRLAPAAVLFAGVVLWGWLQTVPLPLPTGWAHPVWDGVERLGLAAVGGPTISADPQEGVHRVLRLTAYGAAFWLVARAAIDGDRARRMLGTIAVFSTVLASYGLFARSGTNPILGEELTRPGIVQATFVNRNNYATYAGFGVIANLAMLATVFGPMPSGRDRRRWIRAVLSGFFNHGWVFALGTLVCLGAAFLTLSRGGMVSILGGLLVFVLAYRQRRDGTGALLLALAGAIVAFALYFLSSGVLSRILASSSEALRFAIYPEVWAQILERPWLGHGLGGFHDAFRERVTERAAVGEWDFAHSTWLENVHALGIPAAAALFTALGLIVLAMVRGVRVRRRNRALPAAGLGVATIAALHSILEFSLQIPACAGLFAVLLGITWGQSHTSEERGVRTG